MYDEETYRVSVDLTGPQINSLMGLVLSRRKKRLRDFNKTEHPGALNAAELLACLADDLRSHLDEASSTSRQHFIDTGRYLLKEVTGVGTEDGR